MKTVIFVWTTNVCNVKSDNVNGFWGIGDTIRGLICVYYICKELNYEFIVDIQHHPVSKYLKQRDHKYLDLIKDAKDKIPFIYPGNSKAYIIDHSDNITYLFTNDDYKENIDDDCKAFLKDLFTPNEQFQTYIDNKILGLCIEEYSVIHFRLGDDYLVRKNINNELIKSCINIYKNHKEEKQILMSDNNEFKNILVDKEKAFAFNTKIIHLGYKDHENDIEDTLFEFMILLKVKEIKHFSIYGWISGFIKTANIITNVKLIKI